MSARQVWEITAPHGTVRVGLDAETPTMILLQQDDAMIWLDGPAWRALTKLADKVKPARVRRETLKGK